MSCCQLRVLLFIVLLILSSPYSFAASDSITPDQEASGIGMYDHAIRWYDEELVNDPDNTTVLLGKVSSLAALSRWEEVLNGIAVIGLDPTVSPEVAALCAEGYVKTGRPEDALIILDRYPGIPDDAYLRVRAETFIALERESEALSLLTKAEGAGFLNPRLSLLKGIILSGMGNISVALPYLETAVAGLPHDPMASAELGKAVASLGRYEEGLMFTEKAVDLKPDDADLQVLKGYLLGRVGRYDDALDALDRALVLTPESPDIINDRAYTLFLAGRTGEARDLAEEALVQNPANPSAMDTLGSILLAEGNTKEATRYLEQASDLLPGDPEVLTHLADAYRMTGRDNEAQDLYQRAVRIDASSGKTWLGYIEVLMRLGRYQEATDAIAVAYRYYPGNIQLISWEREADKVLVDWYLNDEGKKNSTAES
jgi:tetratricopeptide (TPR) repeat protein